MVSMDYARRTIGCTAALAAAVGLAACGSPAAEPEPGEQTGPCMEQECMGELICVADLCVDPNAPGTGGSGQTTVDTGVASADGTGDSGGPPIEYDAVSILIVMDNSGSMGEEQLAVTQALMGLPAALDEAALDWRIAVTTTDSGNLWCQGTTPEGGSFVSTSCRSRLQNFVFNGAQTVDASESCTEICPAAWETIDIEPSTIEDGSSQARPWIENFGGVSNLPAGLSPADAIGCIVPQGINGCGFERTLDSTWRGLERTQLDFESEFGFLGDGALPVVLIVTDEADCSFNDEHEIIFSPDGNQVFWSDTDSPAPTSAVCWNAGVTCMAGGCSSANKDVNGDPVAPPDAAQDAVLFPLSRYRDQLDGLGSPYVMLIGGVRSDGSVQYTSGADPEFERDFGIGPGCESKAGRAVPPVRMREVVDDYTVAGARNQYSICDADHRPAIDALVAAIVARVG